LAKLGDAAWSAVIKVWPVITEDRAGGHAPGVPWSRTSSWSRNLARMTALVAPRGRGTPQSPAQQQWPPPRSPLRLAGAVGGWRRRSQGRPRAAWAGGAGLQHRLL